MTCVKKRAPEFIVWCGAMFSGKSSALLATVDRLKHQGRSVMSFKASLDERYSQTEIVTHTGWRIPAVPVASGADILRAIVDSPSVPDAVAVDEVFMIDGAASALIELYRSGLTVLASSIDMSAQCKPFREVEAIMPWATVVHKLCAVCAVCKGDAFYTWKTGGSGAEIEVGADELYEARCHACHPIVNARCA